MPLFRDRIPVIVDRVTTLCGPGELIDVIITERGIAINPLQAGPDRLGQGQGTAAGDHRRAEGDCRKDLRQT
ncbi:MAG: hypothetical protein MZV63_61750 [Marinilabiliales bacterium]|nr:hypothetical protein [Marinilabiliales bacterium]